MGGACSSSESSDPSTTYRAQLNAVEDGSLLKLLSIHSAPIHSICVIDPTHLISATDDRKLFVYDWCRHILRQEIEIPTKPPTKVIYNSSSNWIYSGSRCGFIYGWKWSPGNKFSIPHKTLSKHSLSVTCLSTSLDQPHLIVSGSRDNTINVWDVAAETCIRTAEISRNLPTDMKWISNECSIVQSSEDKTVRVWDMRNCTVVQQSIAKYHLQLCCDISHDGCHILTGSSGTDYDGSELTLWDRRNLNGRPLEEFYGHHGNVNSCMFVARNGDKNLLISCSNDSTIKLWNSSIKDCVISHYIAGCGPISSLAGPTPDLIACGTFNDGVHVLSTAGKDNNTFQLRAKY